MVNEKYENAKTQIKISKNSTENRKNGLQKKRIKCVRNYFKLKLQLTVDFKKLKNLIFADLLAN